MLLLCKGCEDTYVIDDWRCPTCTGPRIPRPRKTTEDIPQTPLLDALVARVDLHLAISEALPLLRSGQVQKGIRTLERVVLSQRAGYQSPAFARITEQDVCTAMDRNTKRQCRLGLGHEKNHRYK